MRTQATRVVRILAALTALILLVAVLAGCGNSQSVAIGDGSPQAVLKAALEKAKNVESVSGDFEVAVTVNLDQAQVPQEVLKFLSEPIKISGNFAGGTKTGTAEYAVNVSMAGKTMSVGAKLTREKAFLQLADQWYEAPPELVQQAGQFAYDKEKMEQISKLLDELGFDPTSWFKELQVAGEEKLSGVATYHLVGTPDPAKMVADLVGLMESEELMKLISPGGTGTEGIAANMLPSADELKELESQAAQILQSANTEFWVGKESQELRKVLVNATLVPPAGEEMQGLRSITLGITINFDKYNQDIEVVAPAAALPFTELEKAIRENPEQVLGPFMELLGGMPTNF